MIRPYREEDAVVLTEIWLTASLRAHDFVNDAFWRSRAAEVREVWLPAAKTLVWEENGRPAAFVSIIDNEYIGALFVEPSRQGRDRFRAFVFRAKRAEEFKTARLCQKQTRGGVLCPARIP